MSDTKRLGRDHDNIGPPPEAAQKPHQYRHHGITVDDPFAWLRDAQYPDVNHPEILAYLEAENAYFDAYMSPLKSSIDALFGEMKARRPATDASVPYTKKRLPLSVAVQQACPIPHVVSSTRRTWTIERR